MLKKPSPLKHKEQIPERQGAHATLTTEEHEAVHGGKIDTLFDFEVDVLKPKKKEDKERVNQSNTFRLLTEQEEELFYPSTKTVVAKDIDGKDVKIQQPLDFTKPKPEFEIGEDGKVKSKNVDKKIYYQANAIHWQGDDFGNYKRKNSRWYKTVNGKEEEAFAGETLSKKERAKLNDLNKTLYTGKIDLTDVETWKNRDEKTIVGSITNSNLFPGAIGEDIGPMAKITLPNGEEYTSNPDAEEGAKYKPTQNHGLPITELGKKVQEFYKNTDKDVDLLSSLQFKNSNELRRSWGQLGYKVETTPNSLAKGGQDIVLKDKNNKELASGDINDIKKYLYNNASKKDISRLKQLSIIEARDNINAVNKYKKNLNTAKLREEAENDYLENKFKAETMRTILDSPLQQTTIDAIDKYYNTNMVGNVETGKMSMLNGKSFTDLSFIIETLRASDPNHPDIAILKNLLPRLNKNKETGILQSKNEMINKAAGTYQDQLYRKNKDAILVKMGTEYLERGDEEGKGGTIEKAEIKAGVDEMVDSYSKNIDKYQIAISSLAEDAKKDGVNVSYQVDNFQVTGEDTEKVNFYANKFSALNDAIKATIEDYANTKEYYDNQYGDWSNKYEDVLTLQEKTSRENNLGRMNMSKLNDGFRSMAYSALSIFDEEKAIAKTKSMREGQGFLEAPLDYKTAIETGQKFRFATGELSTQGANVIVAIASGGAGTAMGLGKVGTSMLVGYGVFGAYSGTQKGIDLEIQRQAGEEAKKRLAELEKYKFMYTPQDYMRTKMQLNEAIAYGDISDSDKSKAMLSSFLIEGTVMTALNSFGLGTLPNSMNLINKFKTPISKLKVSNKLLRSDLRAAGDVVWQSTKGVAGEVLEETSIESLTTVGDGLILGRDFSDWHENLDDVAVTSIITSGGMTTLPNTYAAIVQQAATSDFRKDVNKSLNKMEEIKTKFATLGVKDPMRDIYIDEFKAEVEKIAGEHTKLEVDALAMGPGNVRKLVKAAVEENFLNQQAGVTSNDNAATIDERRKAYIESLSPEKAKDYQDRLDAIKNQKNKIIENIDYDNVAEKVFGERGKYWERKLKDNAEYKNADKRGKLALILERIRATKIRSNVKKAKSNPWVETEVLEQTLHIKNKKDRTKVQNAMYQDYAKALLVNQRNSLILAEEGSLSAKNLMDTGQIEGLNITKAKDINEMIDAVYSSETLTDEDKQGIIFALTKGEAKAVIIDNKYVVLDKKAARENLNNGDLLQGTVLSHEISHFVDDMSFKTTEEKANYTKNLYSLISKNTPELHDRALKRVNNITDATGKLLYNESKTFEEQDIRYKDEYTKSVQDMLMDTQNWGQDFETIRNKSGKGFKNILGDTRLTKTKIGKALNLTGDFEINTPANAGAWMVDYIDNFKKGNLSPLARRKMKAAKDAGISVATEGVSMSAAADKARANLKEIQDDATDVDGNFVREKYDPNNRYLLNELFGMVDAQITNYFAARPSLKIDPEGRRELQAEILERLTVPSKTGRSDLNGFDGRGTLYGYLNGRIKYRMLDAFEQNPTIIPDYSQKQIDEARTALEKELADELTSMQDQELDRPRTKTNVLKIGRVADKVNDIKNIVDVEKGDTYKEVTDKHAGPVAQEIFDVPSKKITDPAKNLTYAKKITDGIPEPSEAGNIQNFYATGDGMGKLLKILPEYNVTSDDADINELGENIDVSRTVSGKGLGLKNKLIEFFYDPVIVDGKHKRSTGKTSQVKLYKLKPEFAKGDQAAIDKAREAAGITPRGELNKYDRGIGQFLKGLAFFQGQQVALSAAQRNLTEQAAEKQAIADITAAQSKYAFSAEGKADLDEDTKALNKRLNDSDNIIESMEVEGSVDIEFINKQHRNDLKSNLSSHGHDPMLAFDSKENIDIIISEFKQVGDILNQETANYGIFMKSDRHIPEKLRKKLIVVNEETGEKMMVRDYYKQQVELAFTQEKNLPKNFKRGKQFKGPASKYKKNKPYKTLYGETPADFNRALKKGRHYHGTGKDKVTMTIPEINEMHVSMGTQLWKRINDDIREGMALEVPDKTRARKWAQYLALATNNTQHPHRQWAEFIGWSMNPKGYGSKVYEWEHAMQSAKSINYLMHSILGGYDFNTSFDLIKENYKLIALDNYDDKVKLKGAKRTHSMGDGWSVIDEFHQRYFDKIVAAIEGGINPEGIMTIFDGKNMAEHYNINNEGNPRGVSIGIESAANFSKAASNARKINFETESRGMSAFDFDETLIDKGDNTIIATKGNETIKITSGQWPIQGPALAKAGYKFDFSDFINVRGGVEGPLMQKFRNRIAKYGIENNYILTARPAEAAPAIQAWLKQQGINMPIENITGLGNSTGEAKAMWMAEKYAEGYNDMYFVDDALPNVDAVKDMMDQLDIKGSSVQAKINFSKGINETFNDIIEATTGVESEKNFSDAQAKIRGARTKYKGIIPASAQDFAGLIYNFLGKGKQGETDMAFFKKALIDPFARGINELNASRQSAANDYKNLQKAYPEVKKTINKKIDGLTFTNDQAARVYLWDKAGFEVPGLSKRDLKTLVDHVNNNSDLKAFADGVGVISKKEAGYSAPGDFWLAENITSDLLSDGAIGDARSDILAEWQQNVDIIFSPENLNKIEAIYGSKFREALQDMLYRMKTGRNRPAGGGRLMNMYMNWVNNSVGAIMFFNMRSALLQTISAVNFINWSDNNPIKAAAAFANQPQYWKDFVYLFNSDYLKQRRAGNQRGINEAELSAAVAGAENKAKAAIAWLLKKGFLPTQIADSFAIASGGATFYRNKIKKYVKEGMTQEQAEKQAFLDFQETSEVAQQSARPDMISQQQASPLGRLILSFQNTPMQYARIMNKAARDIANNRGDTKTNISKIIYYGAAQGILFGSLQSALFAALGDDEEEEFDKKKERILNQMVDSVLSGIGYGGKAISTVKNTLLEYAKQKDKGWNADHTYTILTLLGFSPPIGSKLRKVYSSIQTEQFNKGVFKKRGFTLDNPVWRGIGNVVEGVTNVPLGRMAQKMLNLDNAMDSNNEWWQRVALIMGWNTWDLGIKDPDIEAVKLEIRGNKKIEQQRQKEEKKRAKLKEENPGKTDEEIDDLIITKEKSKEVFDLNKNQQVKILKANNLNPKDYPKEKDRVDIIMNLRKENENKIDSTLTAIKNYVPTEEEQKSIELFKMTKKDQVNLLMELGVSTKVIKNLKYEEDRVKKIIELQKKVKK